LRCNIAAGLSQWFSGLVDDYINNLELRATVTTAAFDTIARLTLVDETSVDAIITAGLGIINIGIANTRASFDTDYKENALLCGLYQALGEDGVITNDVLTTWKANIAAYDNSLANVIPGLISGISLETWRRRAYIYSQEEGNCAVCEPGVGVSIVPVYSGAALGGTGDEGIYEVNDMLDFTATNTGFYCSPRRDICLTFTKKVKLAISWSNNTASTPCGAGWYVNYTSNTNVPYMENFSFLNTQVTELDNVGSIGFAKGVDFSVTLTILEIYP
jgi:hypothetical protein